MPTNLRAAVARCSGVSTARERSLRSTSSRARRSSDSVSTSASASFAMSSATPFRRSSTAIARRPNPRYSCREWTYCPANAASSIRPTSLKRSSTDAAASAGTPLRARACASSWRVRARSVSRRRQISRAIAAGSAAGCGSSGSGASGPSRPTRARPRRPRGSGPSGGTTSGASSTAGRSAWSGEAASTGRSTGPGRARPDASDGRGATGGPAGLRRRLPRGEPAGPRPSRG